MSTAPSPIPLPPLSLTPSPPPTPPQFMPHISNWINGVHVPPTTTKIPIHNPATGALLTTIDSTPQSQTSAIITEALANFHSPASWAHSSPQERFDVLTAAACRLRQLIPALASLESHQTGRPIREMTTQLSRVPEWLNYFAALARTAEGSVTPFKGPVLNTLTRSPLGVVLQITPWNHPLLIATKKIAAALAAGNIVIVKPSELAPLSVLRLGEIFKHAGLPDGTLQIVCGYGRGTGKYLCEDPRWAKIDLTGGMATYRAIAPVAALNMVPLAAELGGKAPVCIFPSMDVKKAVNAALFAAFIATGQTCVTGSRILVHTDVYDEFVKVLVERTKRLKVGDPLDPTTQIGALINAAAIERCKDFVARATSASSSDEESVKQQSTLLCGGHPITTLPAPFSQGNFFAPTLIATPSTSPLSQSEIFGPVIAITRLKSEAAIITAANTATPYALGASIWTNDFAQAHRVAGEIQAGIVWVNGHHLNDPSSPWGGWKESGMGTRENGREAFEGYTRLKSTVFNYGVGVDWFEEGKGEGARYG